MGSPDHPWRLRRGTLPGQPFAANMGSRGILAGMQVRPTVLLAISNRKAFLQSYYDRNGTTGVWIPGASAHDLGTQVELEIAFAEERVVLHSRGVVRSKRPADRGHLRAGIGIDFLPSETKTRLLILAFANGQQELMRRRSRRLPVIISVDLSGASGSYAETTENISREGALVTCSDPPELGTVMSVVLKPQGYSTTIQLRAEVRWRRADERPAVGLRFLFDNSAQVRDVNSLLEVLRARLAS
jgi:hypothetical protein